MLPLMHQRVVAAVEGLGIEWAAALVVASQCDMKMTRLINNSVLELAGKYDGFFFPVCSVHPFDGGEALRELERVVVAGARWLKLDPYSQVLMWPLLRSLAALVRKAGDLGVTVLFDAASPTDGAERGKLSSSPWTLRDTADPGPRARDGLLLTSGV